MDVSTGGKVRISGEKREGRACCSENRLPEGQHFETGMISLINRKEYLNQYGNGDNNDDGFGPCV